MIDRTENKMNRIKLQQQHHQPKNHRHGGDCVAVDNFMIDPQFVFFLLLVIVMTTTTWMVINVIGTTTTISTTTMTTTTTNSSDPISITDVTIKDSSMVVAAVSNKEHDEVEVLSSMNDTDRVDSATTPAGSFVANDFGTTTTTTTTTSSTRTLQTIPPPAATFFTGVTTTNPLSINCGGSISGTTYVDYQGRTWFSDTGPIQQQTVYANGTITTTTIVSMTGSSYTYGNPTATIVNTLYQDLYKIERYGKIFSYVIALPQPASYEIVIHLAEIYYTKVGERVFTIRVGKDKVFDNVDIIALTPGKNRTNYAIQLETAQLVDDGFITIEFTTVSTSPGTAKVSGIEIKLVKPHYAHAVISNGPYRGVDTTGTGYGTIVVDGTGSHTHKENAIVSSYQWNVGSTTVSTTSLTSMNLPVGDTIISLTVSDYPGNDTSTDTTTVTILPLGYPYITSISPSSGSISGNQIVYIYGSGFIAANVSTQIIVHFGLYSLSGASGTIEVLNSNTIKVLKTPSSVLGVPVSITVQTPLDTSNSVLYTYVASIPIKFKEIKLTTSIKSPTIVRFGPDRKLYVGSIKGVLTKYTLDDTTYTTILSSVSSLVSPYRPILGIAFDPMEIDLINPTVYISHNLFYHKEWKSTSGNAINGKISMVRGSNLDNIIDIITGLPVSDHDHGVNGIEFGNVGELYINIGGNTNGGIPGQLSGSQLQKENPLSAATLVAYVSNPNFTGYLQYNQDDDGDVIVGQDSVQVFGNGLRNPFSITLHSNGRLYSTDNGPNKNYGDMATGCNSTTDFIPDVEEDDKIVLVEKGHYYGHPNIKRAIANNDVRQCIWKSSYSPSEYKKKQYTAPLLSGVPSSMAGIIEYKATHFHNQLRYNLITCKYKDGLYRTVLSSNGRSVVPESKPIIKLQTTANNGLDITQAPNGIIVQTNLETHSISLFQPNEGVIPIVPPINGTIINTTTAALTNTIVRIHSVFPSRGSELGGTLLDIYGINFDTNITIKPINGTTTATVIGSSSSSTSPSVFWVKMGRNNCPIVSMTRTKIVCTIPSNVAGRIVTVFVKRGIYTSTMERAYRYIKGYPL